MKFNLDSPEFNPLVSNANLETSAGLATANIAALTPATTPKAVDLQPYIQALAQHGGIYRLLDPNFVAAITQRVAERHPEMAPAAPTMRAALTATAPFFFTHLVPNKPYTLDSSLISHLTFPHEGRTYSETNEANPQVPAFMTFTGQFIDHDLTLNPLNLFDSQGGMVQGDASPLLDLDSVYGRDGSGNPLAHGSREDIFNDDGTFELRQLKNEKGVDIPNAFDLVRDTSSDMCFNKPFMYDLRNDENQMILQIHILIERVHNKLVSLLTPEEKALLNGRDEIISYVQREVLNNWQSFVLDDYLPTVVSEEALSWVLTEIVKPGYGEMRHKPEPAELGGTVRMPHEFAIGFRMGHSQLRSHYHVQPQGEPIPLFKNRLVGADDLRGSRPLTLDHIIDWPFFAVPTVSSNRIDSLVTSVVFDLPESTIPDQVKQIGNLPQRNLIRSSQVELAAGEDLVDLYAINNLERLHPEEVEPDPENRKLFQRDESGNYQPDNRFRTPLWYYVLKEAELRTDGMQLGPLGGRIIAEVVAGGIFFMPGSVVHQPEWTSKITGNRIVRFADLVQFVTAQPSPPPAS